MIDSKRIKEKTDFIKSMIESEEVIETLKMQSKLLKMVYDSYIEIGFNENQALELLKTYKIEIGG